MTLLKFLLACAFFGVITYKGVEYATLDQDKEEETSPEGIWNNIKYEFRVARKKRKQAKWEARKKWMQSKCASTIAHVQEKIRKFREILQAHIDRETSKKEEPSEPRNPNL